jgi:RHS repeat-associated protein
MVMGKNGDQSPGSTPGANTIGEESHYIYNGFGDLVANEWFIAKNAYGYTDMNVMPRTQEDGTIPAISSQQMVVYKDYVLDYTKPLPNVIMEYESGAGGLTYRYVYGLRKVNTVIYGIPNGVGSVVQYVYDDESGELVLTQENPGHDVIRNNIVKLYHHQNKLGTTDYLTDNITGKITSFVSYDDFGNLTAKAVLRLGVRELDLVQDYTGHFFDMVLGVYYARARMYDADNRRFMAIDPIKDGWNWYAYCANNPVLYIDPTGLELTKTDEKNLTKLQQEAIKVLTRKWEDANKAGDTVGLKTANDAANAIRASAGYSGGTDGKTITAIAPWY